VPLDAELAEIRDHLAAHPPFDALPDDELTSLPARLQVIYRRRGSVVAEAGAMPTELLMVRSGAVELRDADGELVERGGPGTFVGGEALVSGAPHAGEVTALEDTLLLAMPSAVLDDLRGRHPAVTGFFTAHAGTLLRQAVGRRHRGGSPAPALRTRVRDLVTRAPVTVDAAATIEDAARVMSEERVSSVLVTSGGRLVGIVTDRDLRTRVVAAGVDPSGPVTEVMTPDPTTGNPDALVMEVLLELASRNIHHLPLLEEGGVVGMITATDLLRLQQADPVQVVGEVAKAADPAAVAAAGSRLDRLVASLVRQGTTARDASRVVTTVGDAVERRLIELAEAELGPPPTAYAWVTLGSRARLEQALGPDQDHAMILPDGAPPGTDEYLARLAERVVEGLERAGYPRCTGDKMANNPRWRVRSSVWHEYVEAWVRSPTPRAVVEAGVFFDLRHLHGDPALTAGLARHQREAAAASPIFAAHLAAHAATRPVPLGIFRGLVVDRSGEHRHTLDLKNGGLGVIVEIARVHGLAAGCEDPGSLARLEAGVASGRLSAPLAADLHDAWEFLAGLRLRHQGEEVGSGRRPDNRIEPSALSSFEQRHLKAAFGVIRTAQTALAQRYPVRALT